MTTYREYLLRTGLPMGVVIGLAEAWQGPRTLWWDLILSVSVPAIIIAACHLATTELFVRSVKRSMLSSAILLAISVAVTVIGGVALLLGAGEVPHGRWLRLPDPPASAQSFVGPTCYDLGQNKNDIAYVAASGGQVFAYHRDLGWTTEAVPDSLKARDRNCRTLSRGHVTPIKFGQVLATFRIDEYGADCGGSVYYLLMSDHSIWDWSTGGCALGDVAGYFLFLVVSIAIGLMAGLSRLSTWQKPAR